MELNVKGKKYFINMVSTSMPQLTFKKLTLSKSFGVVLKKSTIIG